MYFVLNYRQKKIFESFFHFIEKYKNLDNALKFLDTSKVSDNCFGELIVKINASFGKQRWKQIYLRVEIQADPRWEKHSTLSHGTAAFQRTNGTARRVTFSCGNNLTPTKPRNLCQYSWPGINHCQWHKPMEGHELTSAERSAMSKRETTDRGAIYRIASDHTHGLLTLFVSHVLDNMQRLEENVEDRDSCWRKTRISSRCQCRTRNFSYPSFPLSSKRIFLISLSVTSCFLFFFFFLIKKRTTTIDQF